MKVRTSGLVLLFGLLLQVATVQAGEDASVTKEPGLRSGDYIPITSLVYFQPGGSFRWRTEVWRSVDMGLGTLANPFGVYRQLYDSGYNEGVEGYTWRESSDLRLRFEPILAISDRVKLRSRIDLLNVPMGDAQVSSLLQQGGVLSGSAGTWGTGYNGASVQVQALWADVDMWNYVRFQIGRVPFHWGVGLTENRGDCEWCDSATYIDTLTASADPFGQGTIELSWDFPYEGQGMTAASGWPYMMDGGDADDIYQLRLKFYTRDSAALEDHGFSFGAMGLLRWQDYSSAQQDPSKAYCGADASGTTPYDCIDLFYRSAVVFAPDLWMNFGWKVGSGMMFLTSELSGNYSDISVTQRLAGSDTSKTILSGGGIVRLGWKNQDWRAVLESGVASGDGDADAFGVLDGYTVSLPKDSDWFQSSVALNSFVTSHVFSPAYLVDTILFRKVIGAVTNAWYLKPEVEMALKGSRDKGLSLGVSTMYAAAVAPEATPGGSSPMGLESQLDLRFRWSHVRANLGATGLLPLSAFDSSDSPAMSWIIRTGLELTF